jgi:hypothetical protein
VTGGKPIAALLQSISGLNAINPLIAFYEIRGRKREVLFFYFVPDTTRVCVNCVMQLKIKKSDKFISVRVLARLFGVAVPICDKKS